MCIRDSRERAQVRGSSRGSVQEHDGRTHTASFDVKKSHGGQRTPDRVLGGEEKSRGCAPRLPSRGSPKSTGRRRHAPLGKLEERDPSATPGCGSRRIVRGDQPSVFLKAAGVMASSGSAKLSRWVPRRSRAQASYACAGTPWARQVATMPRRTQARCAPSVLPAKSMLRRSLATF